MIDAFAAPQALEDAGLLVEMFLGDQQGDGLADRLVRRVAENALSRAGFQVVMMPSSVLVMMASSEDLDDRREPVASPPPACGR